MKEGIQHGGKHDGMTRLEPENATERQFFGLLAGCVALLNGWREWGEAVSDIHNVEITEGLLEATKEMQKKFRVEQIEKD